MYSKLYYSYFDTLVPALLCDNVFVTLQPVRNVSVKIVPVDNFLSSSSLFIMFLLNSSLPLRIRRGWDLWTLFYNLCVQHQSVDGRAPVDQCCFSLHFLFKWHHDVQSGHEWNLEPNAHTVYGIDLCAFLFNRNVQYQTHIEYEIHISGASIWNLESCMWQYAVTRIISSSCRHSILH